MLDLAVTSPSKVITFLISAEETEDVVVSSMAMRMELRPWVRLKTVIRVELVKRMSF